MMTKPDEYSRAISLPWWGVQLLAWSLFCLLSFLSLTLWYGNPRWMHVAHILLQAVTGALVTWPLGMFLPYANLGGLVRRVFSHLVIVGIAAFLWNIFRMATFDAMITAPDIWRDFGGWYFTALLIFGLWAALYYTMQAYTAVMAERSEVAAERMRRIEAENLSRDAQMKMLRYQLNPHFLFNTLNSVSSLVKTKRHREARDMIGQLSNFLRVTLENTPENLTSVKQELEVLDLYLGLEAVRYGDRLTIQEQYDPQSLDLQVPSFILQPMVENALRFSVAQKKNGGTIRISTHVTAENLTLIVEDSGWGLDENMVEGVGLSNIRKRLATHYGEAGQILFGKSDLGGAKITLQMPKQVQL
jgi:sensor histidine kinase YesM